MSNVLRNFDHILLFFVSVLFLFYFIYLIWDSLTDNEGETRREEGKCAVWRFQLLYYISTSSDQLFIKLLNSMVIMFLFLSLFRVKFSCGWTFSQKKLVARNHRLSLMKESLLSEYNDKTFYKE